MEPKEPKKKSGKKYGKSCNVKQNQDQEKKVPELYECRYCRKEYSTAYYRTRHEGIHLYSSETGLKCEFCDYVATLKLHMDRHLKIHNKDKDIFKMLKSNANDNESENSSASASKNIDVKPFSCPMCSFKAKGNPEIQKHVTNVHLEERAFKCPHGNCDYSGKNQWNLSQHSKTHSDSKPFVCPVESCGFKTKWSHHLTRHEKIHLSKDEEKQFKCNFCTLSFHQFSNLSSHMRIHTLEAPFSCQLCPFKGKKKASINSHMKRIIRMFKSKWKT